MIGKISAVAQQLLRDLGFLGTDGTAAVPNHSTDKLTSGTLGVARGGTGQTTAAAAADALLDGLSTTRGAIPSVGASGWAAITPGSSGLPLVSAGAGADPAYGALGVAGGGTGQTSAANAIQALLDAISTTQGVIVYHNGTDWVALSPGTSGHFLKTGGAGANPSWDAAGGSSTVSVLDRDVTSTTVTNTTTETTVYSYSVAGGTLSTNNRIVGDLRGTYANGTSTTLRIRVKYGATTILDTGAFSTVFGATAVRLSFDVTARNATNAQFGTLSFVSGDAFTAMVTPITGTATEDSTASKTLEVTVQWGGADAGNSFVAESTFLKKEG